MMPYARRLDRIGRIGHLGQTRPETWESMCIRCQQPAVVTQRWCKPGISYGSIPNGDGSTLLGARIDLAFPGGRRDLGGYSDANIELEKEVVRV